MLAVLLVGAGFILGLAGLVVLCWPVALIAAGCGLICAGLLVDLEKPEPDL